MDSSAEFADDFAVDFDFSSFDEFVGFATRGNASQRQEAVQADFLRKLADVSLGESVLACVVSLAGAVWIAVGGALSCA
jgi:hypothetical protein